MGADAAPIAVSLYERGRTVKSYILSLNDTSIDITDVGQFRTIAQAERHFRRKWKWCDDLVVTEYTNEAETARRVWKEAAQ